MRYLSVMAQKDDLQRPGAAGALKGLAGDMAVMVRGRADAFMAEPATSRPIEAEMRAVALIARAALALQALQAAEDKAEQRATDAEAKRQAACVHARNPIHDEADETNMNERDPRLDTPQGVAEIYEDARRSVDRVFRRLEIKRADQRAGAGGNGGDAAEKLDGESERPTAPAH